MKTIRSQFNLTRVFFIPALLLTLSFGLSYSLLKSSFSQADVGFLLLGLIFLLNGVLLFWYYLGRYYRFSINAEGIRIKGCRKQENWKWSSIQGVKAPVRVSEQYLFFRLFFNAVQIQPKGEMQQHLLMHYYRNSPLLIAAIQHYQQENRGETIKPFVPPSQISFLLPSEVNLANSKLYCGQWATSYAGINFLMLLSFSLFLFFGLFMSGFTDLSIMAATMFCLGFAVRFANQLYYFRLTKDSLVVLHHLWPYKTAISLSDINELRWRSYGNVTQLSLITRDYKIHRYGADSLRYKRWAEFSRDLRQKGVEVKF